LYLGEIIVGSAAAITGSGITTGTGGVVSWRFAGTLGSLFVLAGPIGRDLTLCFFGTGFCTTGSGFTASGFCSVTEICDGDDAICVDAATGTEVTVATVTADAAGGTCSTGGIVTFGGCLTTIGGLTGACAEFTGLLSDSGKYTK